jgi:hypothetical protein
MSHPRCSLRVAELGVVLHPLDDPGEDIFDGASFELFLDRLNGHKRCCINYDPSHKPLMLSPYLINPGSLPQHLSQQSAYLEGEAEVIRCDPTTSARPLWGAGMRATRRGQSATPGEPPFKARGPRKPETPVLCSCSQTSEVRICPLQGYLYGRTAWGWARTLPRWALRNPPHTARVALKVDRFRLQRRLRRRQRESNAMPLRSRRWGSNIPF